MPYSTRVIRELENLDPKLKGVFLALLEEIEKSVKETVKRTDFLGLKEIVAELGRKVSELAEAQKRTEQKVTELAEAQKRTEERINELVEAQKRTEERINELAESQKKSEERLTRLESVVSELAEAQKKTEQKVTELSEAQKRTEQELRALVQDHKKTRELLGNLSDTVGYGLEDRIMPYVPAFAVKEFGIKVDLIERRNIVYPDGRYDEVNIYVEGKKNGEKVYMIGECKAKPGKKDIDRFYSLIKRLSAHLKGQIYPFIVGYVYSPDVEGYIKEKYPEVRMVKSFEFELKYSRRP
ncbi:MAG: hypothetical protein N2513_10440 [Deltaproteobacteria bacterium]|nr:hypothetical protein [Deltaproteobacteria bacterium]